MLQLTAERGRGHHAWLGFPSLKLVYSAALLPVRFQPRPSDSRHAYLHAPPPPAPIDGTRTSSILLISPPQATPFSGFLLSPRLPHRHHPSARHRGSPRATYCHRGCPSRHRAATAPAAPRDISDAGCSAAAGHPRVSAGASACSTVSTLSDYASAPFSPSSLSLAPDAPAQRRALKGPSVVGATRRRPWRTAAHPRQQTQAVRASHAGGRGRAWPYPLPSPNRLYAMKVVDRRIVAVAKNNRLEHAASEKQILRVLDHPFLPLLFTGFDDIAPHFCVVMVFSPAGGLHSLRHHMPNRHGVGAY
ncbi:protein kinase PINOID-like [Miscanthus floridulus]|uniref:protein kinase PINOID-like n=1 Tax=Miscanthus floridulus TaxID=154761 RepID=UPI003458A8F9